MQPLQLSFARRLLGPRGNNVLMFGELLPIGTPSNRAAVDQMVIGVGARNRPCFSGLEKRGDTIEANKNSTAQPKGMGVVDICGHHCSVRDCL